MKMRHKNINFAAVIVAALAHFALGAAWFGGIFQKAWIAGAAFTPAQMQAAEAHNVVPFVVAFIGSFGMAVVIARIISYSGINTALAGARLGLMLGVGLAMLPMMIEVFFEAKHLRFALVVGAYPAVGSLIMGTILGAWQTRSAVPLTNKAAAS
jgi:Protein of unknown function (DUF1761)